jgi:hypothetical protein
MQLSEFAAYDVNGSAISFTASSPGKRNVDNSVKG